MIDLDRSDDAVSAFVIGDFPLLSFVVLLDGQKWSLGCIVEDDALFESALDIADKKFRLDEAALLGNQQNPGLDQSFASL